MYILCKILCCICTCMRICISCVYVLFIYHIPCIYIYIYIYNIHIHSTHISLYIYIYSDSVYIHLCMYVCMYIYIHMWYVCIYVYTGIMQFSSWFPNWVGSDEWYINRLPLLPWTCEQVLGSLAHQGYVCSIQHNGYNNTHTYIYMPLCNESLPTYWDLHPEVSKRRYGQQPFPQEMINGGSFDNNFSPWSRGVHRWRATAHHRTRWHGHCTHATLASDAWWRTGWGLAF